MKIPHLQKKPHRSGLARLVYQGKTLYFGKFGTKESEKLYRAWVSALLAENPPTPTVGHAERFTVADLVMAYLPWAERYYVAKEYQPIKRATSPLNDLHGNTLVENFGPLALKEVRQAMIALDWSRQFTNHQVQRIRRMFKWGVEQELVQPHILAALQAVAGLKKGKTTAREAVPQGAVDDCHVNIVLPHLPPSVAAMIRLLRLTGMRPSNLCDMRAGDLENAGEALLYRPSRHKTDWRGKELVIVLGPQCKTILEPFLNRPPEARLFTPMETMQWHWAQRRATRKTKVQPSQVCRRKKRPKKVPGDVYEPPAIRNAVKRVIGRLNVQRSKQELPTIPVWTPYQLRRSRATELRKLYGVEAAQVVLGHSHISTTELYAEKSFKAALRIALESG